MEIELLNTGKVAFDYLVIDVNNKKEGGGIIPCQLNVTPSTVSLFVLFFFNKIDISSV